MSIVLFIGGSKDGQWTDIPDDLTTVQVAIMPKMNISLIPDQYTAELLTFKTELYERQYLSGTNTVFHMFVLKGLSIDDTLKQILENYTPKNNEGK